MTEKTIFFGYEILPAYQNEALYTDTNSTEYCERGKYIFPFVSKIRPPLYPA